MRSIRVPATVLLAALLLPAVAGAEPLFLPCREEGSWLRADRQVHFGGSLAIAASLRVEGRSRAEAVAGTFAVGIAKEIYDAALKPKGLGRGMSRKDLAADLLGAVAGVLLIAAMDR
jgi:uncharacterized protein YfiM (DUF2279 family)